MICLSLSLFIVRSALPRAVLRVLLAEVMVSRMLLRSDAVGVAGSVIGSAPLVLLRRRVWVSCEVLRRAVIVLWLGGGEL